MKQLYLRLFAFAEKGSDYFWESSFPSIREHVVAVEKAATKMIGLMVGCRRDHKTAVYDRTIINADSEILMRLGLAMGMFCRFSVECNSFCVRSIC